MVITLTAKNSQAPQNIIRFDHTTGEFATVKLAESMIDHLEIESTSIHRDSEEGQKQLNSGKEEKGKSKKLNCLFFFNNIFSSFCKISYLVIFAY